MVAEHFVLFVAITSFITLDCDVMEEMLSLCWFMDEGERAGESWWALMSESRDRPQLTTTNCNTFEYLWILCFEYVLLWILYSILRRVAIGPDWHLQIAIGQPLMHEDYLGGREEQIVWIPWNTLAYHLWSSGSVWKGLKGSCWLRALKRLHSVYQKIDYVDHSMGEGAKIPRGADSEIWAIRSTKMTSSGDGMGKFFQSATHICFNQYLPSALILSYVDPWLWRGAVGVRSWWSRVPPIQHQPPAYLAHTNPINLPILSWHRDYQHTWPLSWALSDNLRTKTLFEWNLNKMKKTL